MRRVFLVFGLARSGTSLTARLLHELGVPMGEGLQNGNRWNRDGFYEDSAWNDLCRRHNKEGCRMHEGRIDPAMLGRPVVQEMQALAAARSSQHALWGVKNLLIPYFLASFAEWCLPHELSLVLCTRPFHAAINSYRKMEGLTEPPHATAAALSFGLYLFETLYERHAGPKIRIAYDDTLRDAAGAVQRLAAFTGTAFRHDLAAIVAAPAAA